MRSPESLPDKSSPMIVSERKIPCLRNRRIMGDLVQFLKEKTLSQVVSHNNAIIEANSDDIASEAFKKLAKHSILSLPIKDSSGNYTAFFDVLDVLYYVSSHAAKDINDTLGSVTCIELANFSKRNLFAPVVESTNLITVVQTFSRNYKDLHRLPIINDKGDLVGIASQSLIVSWLAPHVTKFDFGKLSIGKLGLGLEVQKVETVKDTDKVSVALKKIKECAISGVGIVDSHGKLIGNFSASDLKYFGIGSSTLQLFSSTMSDYLKALKLPNTGSDYPYSVTKSSTVQQVVKKFSETKAHRLYVVEKELPIGIISLVDVIELFLRHLVIE